MTLYYFRRGSMEDHINDTHNESFVEGLSLEDNLTFTISNKIIVTIERMIKHNNYPPTL